MGVYNMRPPYWIPLWGICTGNRSLRVCLLVSLGSAQHQGVRVPRADDLQSGWQPGGREAGRAFIESLELAFETTAELLSG